MRNDRNLLMAGLTAASLLLTGCGGGGGGGGTPATAANPPPTAAPGGGSGTPPPESPDPGTVFGAVARGTVTGFGSVYLNGKRYATDDAQFIIDGKPGSQDDLAVGMIVNLAGDLDNGVASVVRFDEDIKGPVDAIDGDTLTVFGQAVLLVPETRYDEGLELADILIGDVLEISGLRDADDALVASFIEREVSPEEYEVTGRVRDLDEVGQTFSIGGLTVDYSAAELDDLNGGLENGALVEVSDDALVYTPGALTLVASKVEGRSLTVVIDDDDELDDSFAEADDREDEDDDRGDVGDGTELEIEGLITEVLSADRFVIDGIEVLLTDGTEFEYGDRTALVVGARVEVDGEVNEDGQLVAEEIELADNEGRVAGLVEAVDADAGELLVFGVRVRVSVETELEDEREESEMDEEDDSESDSSDEHGMPDLSGLLVGDYVEVEGVVVDGLLYAEEIEVDEIDRTELRGPVTAADAEAGTLTVLGIALVTDARTEYEADDDRPLTREAFFDALALGQTAVEAQWDDLVTDASVAVAELELED